MERMAMVVGIKPEKIAEYKRLHAGVWPEILEMISKCNITNYSFYLREQEKLLFGYWEYTGGDFAADPRTQDWWEVCKPLQAPLDTRTEGEWWAMMEEVFHHD